MAHDITRVVELCTVCAVSKSSHQLPASKLMPLQVPDRLWFHIAVDFGSGSASIEGLHHDLCGCGPFFKGFLKDSFFCASFCSPGCMICHYSIPENILSDRSLQFVSRVWGGFFQKLGTPFLVCVLSFISFFPICYINLSHLILVCSFISS